MKRLFYETPLFRVIQVDPGDVLTASPMLNRSEDSENDLEAFWK